MSNATLVGSAFLLAAVLAGVAGLLLWRRFGAAFGQPDQPFWHDRLARLARLLVLVAAPSLALPALLLLLG